MHRRLIHRCLSSINSSSNKPVLYQNKNKTLLPEHQQKLPSLPIPALEHTALIYTESCLPFLNKSSHDKNNDKKIETKNKEWKAMIHESLLKEGSLGSQLQSRLIAQSADTRVCLIFIFIFIFTLLYLSLLSLSLSISCVFTELAGIHLVQQGLLGMENAPLFK